MDSEEDTGDEDLITDSVEDINEDEAADLRAKLQAKGGDKKYDTKRMGKEGLKNLMTLLKKKTQNSQTIKKVKNS